MAECERAVVVSEQELEGVLDALDLAEKERSHSAPPVPKTVVDHIHEWLAARSTNTEKDMFAMAMALYEAVEKLSWGAGLNREYVLTETGCNDGLKGILAILRGTKAREIPK